MNHSMMLLTPAQNANNTMITDHNHNQSNILDDHGGMWFDNSKEKSGTGESHLRRTEEKLKTQSIVSKSATSPFDQMGGDTPIENFCGNTIDEKTHTPMKPEDDFDHQSDTVPIDKPANSRKSIDKKVPTRDFKKMSGVGNGRQKNKAKSKVISLRESELHKDSSSISGQPPLESPGMMR